MAINDWPMVKTDKKLALGRYADKGDVQFFELAYLETDAHVYEKAGKYRMLVKAIDIFGNDTSQAFDVEVR